ncbi:MAG: S41 family peptidase [Treponema sp.]|nr:S41 family peptidase [Treponema sp.]
MKTTFRSSIMAFVVLFCATQCFAQSSTKDNKLSAYQYMKKLNSVFDYVEQNYVDELDPKILYEGAIKGMLDAIGDPYTVYLDPDYMRDLNDTTEGSFGGVGLSISKAVESTPEKPAYVEVASPIEDTPGQRAGIQAGDLITAINGMSTPEMTMNEVLGILRGKIGEPVTVSIRRGANMNFDVTLIRALIEVPTVKYGMIGNIGYVRLIQFTPETPHRVQEALDSFEKNKYTGLIIDLRDNPGGLITSVSEIADKFIDNGPIVSTKSRLVFENQIFNSSKQKTVASTKGKPIIVLINRGSASASEILSGALKDNHLALLVGERTYGKGSVQQVIPLSDVDGMKITMARYYTPSDTNIDKIGIPPDVEVKYPELTKEAETAYVQMVNDNVIENLVAASGKMTEKEIAEQASILAKTYPLEERLLRRLIRNQVNKTEPAALYDLDYDLQLGKALELIDRKDFDSMVKNAKTLKELQNEVEFEEKK